MRLARKKWRPFPQRDALDKGEGEQRAVLKQFRIAARIPVLLSRRKTERTTVQPNALQCLPRSVVRPIPEGSTIAPNSTL